MARLFAILRATGTASWRRQKTLGSVGGNNILMMSVILLQQNGGFVYLLIGLAILFPLSTDAWQRVPEERRALWPITAREQRWLRIGSLGLNPVVWLVSLIAIMAALSAGATWGVVALGFVILGAGFFAPALPKKTLPIPGPPWLAKGIRELTGTLDFYCALALSVGGLAYQATGGHIPKEGKTAMAMLMGVALSSYAACLFGFDADGVVRYRIWPVKGWQVLLGKGIPYVVAVVILTLPYSALGGFAAALVALAVGHAPAIGRPVPQMRWRFTTGATLGMGFLQTFLIGGAVGTQLFYPWISLSVVCTTYLASLAFFGRRLEKGWRGV